MSRKYPIARHTAGPLLLPSPSARDIATSAPPAFPLPRGTGREETEWATVIPRKSEETDLVRQQRDGLARLRERLLAAVRELEAENEVLREQLRRYQSYPPIEQQEDEATDARQLEQEQGLAFHRMPEDVYPGKPYVTQQDLIRRGITRYSRQNVSRLTRDERSVPAMLIADRVLLPPAGVRTLLDRENIAARDPSPRRRPGAGRASGIRQS